MDKPIELRQSELALLAAYQRYDALDKDGVDAEQRVRNGTAFCRAHPEDRAAGVTLSKLRQAESKAYVAQVQAKQAYDALHLELGADDEVWVLEAETWRYMEAREHAHL